MAGAALDLEKKPLATPLTKDCILPTGPLPRSPIRDCISSRPIMESALMPCFWRLASSDFEVTATCFFSWVIGDMRWY